MFRMGSFISHLKTVFVIATLAHSCTMVAQRGAASVGGGTAGAGAMGRSGPSTGLDIKDDLKTFHETLALQANSQQIIEYKLMIKETESASAELRAMLEQAAKENNASAVAGRDKAFEQALEKARTENTAFLQKLSDRQKSGLKDTIKKLVKTDSDLAQESKALDVAIDTKTGGNLIANSAQNLQRTLTSFQNQQVDLGEEMSIGAGDSGQDVSFKIPPVKSAINFAGLNPASVSPSDLSVAITTSGLISKGALQAGENIFRFELTADLSDLQQHISEVLGSQLDKGERCGEQIVIQNANLTPSTPASVVLVQMHYERWACFGSAPNEMAEGNGAIEVKLLLGIGEDGSLHLVPTIGRVDAKGLLGDLLPSGTLGEVVRDRITESLLTSVRPASNYNALLPSAAQGNIRLRRAQFLETGAGRVSVVLNGDIQVSSDKAAILTSELKASEAKGPSSTEETAPH